MKPKDAYDHYEQGKHDAERDRGAGFTDLITLGLASDSSYRAPRERDDRDAYNEGWKAGKGQR